MLMTKVAKKLSLVILASFLVISITMQPAVNAVEPIPGADSPPLPEQSGDGTERSIPNQSEALMDQEVHYFDPFAGSVCIDSGSLTSTSLSDFPQESVEKFEAHLPKIEFLKEDYEAASAAEGVPWAMIAAVHYREGGNNPDRSPLAGEAFGTPNPDGHGTIRNMEEGLIKSAELIKSLAKMAYDVEVKADGTNSFEELQQIFVAYNRGVRYKDPAYGGPISPDRSPYVMNGYDAEHMNMSWNPPMDTVSGRDMNLGALTVYSMLLGGAIGCDGELGVGEDGFTFPVVTTQTAIKNEPPTARWCFESQTNCHHSYNAADIFAPTGTKIVAAMPGKVKKVSPNSGGCSTGLGITIKGASGDGRVYYYAHMSANSAKVSEGNDVEAGQELGAIGTNNDAQCTPRHLHFDMLPDSYDFRVGCGYGCSNTDFLNVQPALISAFNNLPQ